MTSFENVVVIERPRDEVFAFLANFENVPRWNPEIEVTRKMTPDAVEVGTAYQQVRRAPIRTEEEFVVVAFDRPRRLMIRGDIGSFRAAVSYALEVVGEATRLTTWVELEPSAVISKVMVTLAASQIKAAVASNLDLLKRILEDRRHIV